MPLISIDDVPLPVVERAYVHIVYYLTFGLSNWPEDHWESMSADWDLNVSHNDNMIFAVLYPVKDGQTDTSQSINLLIRHIKSEEFSQ